jgi:Lipoate-protein ligase B
MHGIGLNIETDMDRFSQIEPCGFDSSIMTSLSLITRQKFNMDLEKKVLSDIIKKEMGII